MDSYFLPVYIFSMGVFAASMCPSPRALSLLPVSHHLCLLLNGKQRIFGGFLTTYPRQTNDRREASGLVIILSHGPWLARLVRSQTDKAFVGVSVSDVYQSGSSQGHGYAKFGFSALEASCKQKTSRGHNKLFAPSSDLIYLLHFYLHHCVEMYFSLPHNFLHSNSSNLHIISFAVSCSIFVHTLPLCKHFFNACVIVCVCVCVCEHVKVCVSGVIFP